MAFLLILMCLGFTTIVADNEVFIKMEAAEAAVKPIQLVIVDDTSTQEAIEVEAEPEVGEAASVDLTSQQSLFLSKSQEQAPVPSPSPVSFPAPVVESPVPRVAVDVLAKMVALFEARGVQQLVQSFLEGLGFSSLAATLTSLIDARSNFDETNKNLTIFVPSNVAIGLALQLPGIDTVELGTNSELQETVLLYHVVDGPKIISSELEGIQELETEAPKQAPLVISASDEGVFITDSLGRNASVLVADLEYNDKVVFHIIDLVLIPSIF